MKEFVCLLILSAWMQAGICQPTFEFANRKLLKEIEKYWSVQDPVFTKLELPFAIGESKSVKGNYYSVRENIEDDHLFFLYVGRVNSCRAGGCSLNSYEGDVLESEYFDYYIMFDTTAKIIRVKVFNYQATHGHEITSRGWLKQFTGYEKDNNLKVGKNVDAISGATISVYAITDDIQLRTGLLGSYLEN